MHRDLVKFLIAKGVHVNVKLKSGETTLHAVARRYSEKHASKVCKLLISNGAQLNEKNFQGLTPLLDEALTNKRNQTAAFLRKQGAKTTEELKTEGKWNTYQLIGKFQSFAE